MHPKTLTPGKFREVSSGFKSSKERMLQNINSSDISLPMATALAEPGGRKGLPVFCCFGDGFPRCILGVNTGQ